MWVVKLERVIDGRTVCQQDLVAFDRPARLEQLGDFGLTLDEGKAIFATAEQGVISEQVEEDAYARRICDGCAGRRM